MTLNNFKDMLIHWTGRAKEGERDLKKELLLAGSLSKRPSK